MMRKLAGFREPLPWTSVSSDAAEGLKALGGSARAYPETSAPTAMPSPAPDTRRISRRYAQLASPTTPSLLYRIHSFSSIPEMEQQAAEIQKLYVSENEAKSNADGPTSLQENELESHYTCGWAAVCSKYESDLKQLRAQLESERRLLASIQLKYQELQQSNESCQKELYELKLQKEGSTSEVKRLQMELDARISENLKLEEEIKRKAKQGDLYKLLESLKATLTAFHDDNTHFQEHEEPSTHTLNLEKTFRRDQSTIEDLESIGILDAQSTDEVVLGLYKKVTDCIDIVNLKSIEILNLQAAMSKYFAEHEARELAEKEVVMAKEELSNISESLKVAKGDIVMLKKEKADALSKLSEANMAVLESKMTIQTLQKEIFELHTKVENNTLTIQKLEEGSAKLQSALELSTSQINRMIMDFENHVDRRIIINLLVAYIQRNHTREVLELMMRILRFTNEDIKRIDSTKQTRGKHIVDGILSFPSRIVSGVFKTQPMEDSTEPQSLSDLWVEFLQKDEDAIDKKATTVEEAESSCVRDQPPHVNSDPNGIEVTSATVPLLSSTPTQQKDHEESSSFLKCF